ncbi:plasmid partitioning protein RepB [Acetobacter vaccinii]|uniref:Plasmid partitioning protein RepB n=1 Tax=Acetobacter vaccinii TaxID=2592655 RepID=A0A5C1YUZ1_9PROT|nr:plasmid partitioning protein RepB [Acetobacter vaccinii]QEO18962.1 plasmid partitioning protein RepB [Acetobacter vaccinii]
MARKNTLGFHSASSSLSSIENGPQVRPSQTFRTGGALGSVAKSLGSLAETANKAEELERTLREGTIVVELNPELIDDAFVRDRLDTKDDGYEELKTAIRETGQLSPVLVRPHPSVPGRYQIAFGHRRVMVCRELNRQVKASVKEMTDHELVVALGQENSMRTDLSFLERALFGQRLEAEGYDRQIIMTALGVDKTLLSRMLTIVERIPETVVNYVGRSPTVGRTRWQELSDFFRDQKIMERCVHWLHTEDALNIPLENRFKALLKEANRKSETHGKGNKSVKDWVSSDNKISIQANSKKNITAIETTSDISEEFSKFLISELPILYARFQEGNG